MADYRERYIEGWVTKMLGFSPLVGLFGHRQVGKTAMSERISNHYITFDQAKVLASAQSQPMEFLQAAARKSEVVVIDECQLAPELFPALKEFVRLNKKPGQFLLTGSVRFTSRRVIRESLTGRIVNIVIPPLGIGELCELQNPKVLESMLFQGLDRGETAARFVSQDKESDRKLTKSLLRYMGLGGLPGVCFLRNSVISAEKFDSQLDTLLERDLRLICETTLPTQTLRRVLTELAANVGEPVNISAIQRKTRVSAVTLRKLFGAFNAMFLIDFIPMIHRSGQPLVYFCDTGEASHLANNRLGAEQLLAQTIYSNLNAALSNLWRGNFSKVVLSTYRTRGGTNIPLVLISKLGSIGFLPILSDVNFDSILAQTKSFMEVPNALGVVAVGPPETPLLRHHKNLLQMPSHLLFA